jgi:hypothetical protein
MTIIIKSVEDYKVSFFCKKKSRAGKQVCKRTSGPTNFLQEVACQKFGKESPKINLTISPGSIILPFPESKKEKKLEKINLENTGTR